MLILNDFSTNVHRALREIDPDYMLKHGLVICGTHSPKSVEEYIDFIRLARENKTPTLLICFGYQLGAIQWARDNGIPDATSEEFGKGTFVVKKRPELKVGLHDGESWWSYYDVDIKWDIPEHFVAVPYHPEYQSRLGKPHPDLVKFLDLCKNK